MKQTRMIRIFLLSAAVLIAVAFWGGYYYGVKYIQQENILTASEGSKETTPIHNPDITKNRTASTDTLTEKEEAQEPAVESMKDIRGKQYYLKADGDYLAVYQSDTDQLYFETGLKLSDLPADLRKEAEEGIAFSGMEELYSFLENYSS